MGFRALCGGSRAERLSAGGSWQRPPEPSPRTRISRRASPTCQSAFTPAFWPPSMTTEESVLTQEPRPTSGLGPSPRLLSLPGAPPPPLPPWEAASSASARSCRKPFSHGISPRRNYGVRTCRELFLPSDHDLGLIPRSTPSGTPQSLHAELASAFTSGPCGCHRSQAPGPPELRSG